MEHRHGAASDALGRVPSRTTFRPSSRSRVRIATGTLLATVAVGVVLLLFSAADRRVAVLQLVRDVPAGSRLDAADLRSVAVSVESSLAVVRSSGASLVVGQYAKVRMVAGSLLTTAMLQPGPLVAPGSAVVAVTFPAGELPAGLRERSRVQLVVTADPGHAGVASVVGRVVGLPTAPDDISGDLSLSVEVSVADAVTVAAAPHVRVVLLDPGTDAASDPVVAGDTTGVVPS